MKKEEEEVLQMLKLRLPCIPLEDPMLEQLNISLKELHIENSCWSRFFPERLQIRERTNSESGEKYEDKAASERNCYELTVKHRTAQSGWVEELGMKK